MKNNRLERVAEQVRQAVSEIVRFELQDPRIFGVTVTGVKMSADLGFARVYFTVEGGEKRAKEAKEGLKNSAKAIRHRVSERLTLKFAPQFDFFYDESFELQGRIDLLFQELEKESSKH